MRSGQMYFDSRPTGGGDGSEVGREGKKRNPG